MAPATSTQSLVINLICTKIQGLGLTIDGNPVMVYDGPEGPDNEDNFVVVMCDENDPEPQGTQEWAALGSRARYENYDVIIGVFSYMGGDDSTGGGGASDAQLGARTNAATIEAAIEAAMLADINLATANSGTAPVIWCQLTSTTITQLPPDDESGMGRFTGWRMIYHVYNRLSGG